VVAVSLYLQLCNESTTSMELKESNILILFVT
jgi:hypothetical protein